MRKFSNENAEVLTIEPCQACTIAVSSDFWETSLLLVALKVQRSRNLFPSDRALRYLKWPLRYSRIKRNFVCREEKFFSPRNLDRRLAAADQLTRDLINFFTIFYQGIHTCSRYFHEDLMVRRKREIRLKNLTREFFSQTEANFSARRKSYFTRENKSET